MIKKTKIIPVFVPHQGCPNDCYFCNQKKITGKDSYLNIEEIEKFISESLKTIPPNIFNVEIAFFGGSFTAINAEIQIKLLEIAYKYKKNKIVNKIRISTRPDAINPKILDLLEYYLVDIIEIGVQSMDSDVLFAINRGHSVEDIINASKLIKERKFILGHQIMPGLYGSSFDKDIITAINSIELAPDIVRIYPTLVIRDTKLEELFNNNEYKPLTLLESIQLVSIIYSLYEKANIKVIRIGLQPTENIAIGKDIIAGPFHPAYKQIIISNIISNSIVQVLDRISFNNLEITCNEELYNYIVGIKKENLEYIKNHLGIELFKYRKDNSCKDIILKTGKELIKLELNDCFNIYINNSKELGYVLKRNNN